MKKGLIPLLSGIFLFFFSFFILPFFALWPFFKNIGSDERFELPGVHEAKLEEAGKYVLWEHYDGLHENVSFQHDEPLPADWHFEVLDASGEVLALTEDRSTSSSVNERVTKRSLATFEIAEPTTVRIQVVSDDSPRLFSLKKSIFDGFVKNFLGVVISIILLSLLSLILAIYGLVKLTQSPKSPPIPNS
ncbi:MAG: hypothetical protein ACQKBY_02765 [Verrucomicrobiales bacterium]